MKSKLQLFISKALSDLFVIFTIQKVTPRPLAKCRYQGLCGCALGEV